MSETLPECPECGTEMYHPTRGPTLFCDECDREYWQEGETWFSCGFDGVITRV